MACDNNMAGSDTDVTSRKGEDTPSATREESRFISPPVDIYETEEGLTVVADLPGVELGNVEIRVEEDQLTIMGRTSPAAEKGNSLHQEFRLVNFHRQFKLGNEVDQEKISAGVKDGVLSISLPKAARVKPRRIEVKVA